MADSRISDLASANLLDGTEVIPLVQSSDTKKVESFDLGGSVLFNDYVDDTVTATGSGNYYFTLGSTIDMPTMQDGDILDIQFSLTKVSNSGNTALRTLVNFDGEALLPSLGNTPLLVGSANESICKYRITKLSSTEAYYEFNIAQSTGGIVSSNSMFFDKETITLSDATEIQIGVFLPSASMSYTLNNIYIKHTR